MADPIVIVDLDPGWPLEFERLRDRVAAAVGDLAVAIEHIGSTAIPGLAAKPVIDLVVVVEVDDVQGAIERLSTIGYVHRGNLGVEGREAFDAPRVFVVITSTCLRPIVRSCARSWPSATACANAATSSSEYEALKRDLAAKFRDDRMGYTDAKTDFVTAASR